MYILEFVPKKIFELKLKSDLIFIKISKAIYFKCNSFYHFKNILENLMNDNEFSQM